MAERPTFGRRGVKTGSAPDAAKSPRRAPPPRFARASDEPSSGAAAVATARKRIAGWSLATAGALPAASLWFVETSAEPCLDDPATPLVDESKAGDCADRAAASRGHTSGRWVHWFWRSGSGTRSSSFYGGTATGAKSTSSASRGGFGSSGFFHGFGGG